MDPKSPSVPAAIIVGCSGKEVTPDEKAFFEDFNPLGFILFARNIDNPEQIRGLIQGLKDSVGRDAPILIDQEGGRVARLKAPHWPEFSPAQEFGDLFNYDFAKGIEATRINATLIGLMLRDLGITVDCAPVLDVPVDRAHDVIGDRAFSHDPKAVAALGSAACQGFLNAGVTPVIKHIPGHGRALADSHEELPVIESRIDTLKSTDFVPFQDMAGRQFADGLWAMVAHVQYNDLDPYNPASTSQTVINSVIRGRIGFRGVLIADDISMKALEGGVGERALATLKAGNDVTLHCNGDLAEMQDIATLCPVLRGESIDSLNQAFRACRAAETILLPEMIHDMQQRLAELLPVKGKASYG